MNTPIPFLAVDDAARAIEFYERAFGARERMRMPTPNGRIAHAEIELAGSVVMLADPLPQYNWKPPRELGGTSVASGSTSRTSTPPCGGRWRRARH